MDTTEEQPGGIERRMVHRLLTLWRDARGEGPMPTLAAVLAQDLADILPDMYVIALPPGGGEPTFERLGPAIAEEIAADLVGEPLSAVPEGCLLKQALECVGEVVDRKVPMTRGGEFTNTRGQTILFRGIIAPLGDDAGSMRYLLGAANCKVVDAAA